MFIHPPVDWTYRPKALLVALATLALCGCFGGPAGGGGRSVTVVDLPGNAENCAGFVQARTSFMNFPSLIDITLRYDEQKVANYTRCVAEKSLGRMSEERPPGSYLDDVTGAMDECEASTGINKAWQNPMRNKRIGDFGFEQTFVQQSDPDLCWAATLQMAFRFYGYDEVDQEHFVGALENACPNRLGNRATLTEIMYAASAIVSDGTGIWPVFTGQGMRGEVGFPSLRSINIQPKNRGLAAGGLYPIGSLDEFLKHLFDRTPVILGLGGDFEGHTVLVEAVTLKADLEDGLTVPLDGSKLRRSAFATLEKIFIVDPQDGPEAIPVPADLVLRNMLFALAVKLPERQ